MSSSADWNSLPQLKLQMSLGEWSSSCCRLFFILWARSSRPRPTTCTSSVPVLCFTRYFALITSDKTAAHREIQDWIYFSYLVGGGSDRRRDLHTVSAALLVYSRIAVPCTISIPVSVGKCSQWQINTWIHLRRPESDLVAMGYRNVRHHLPRLHHSIARCPLRGPPQGSPSQPPGL